MRKIALMAIGLLVLLNSVLLVAVARTDNAAAPDDATVQDLSGLDEDETPDPSDEATAFGEDAAVALAVAGDGTALRVWRGSCAQPGSTRLDVSADGGASFDEAPLPVGSDADDDGSQSVLRTVLGVRAESAEEMTIVGNDADCETRSYETTDGGQQWEERESFDGWYVAAAPAEVGTPEGIRAPGCEALRVDPLSEVNAKVLCTDGSIRGTNDAGLTWSFLGLLTGGADVAFTDISAGLALAPDGECEARALTTGDAGGQWQPAGCASGSLSPRSLVARGETAYALVGTQVRVSTDGGATWANPGEGDEPEQDE